MRESFAGNPAIPPQTQPAIADFLCGLRVSSQSPASVKSCKTKNATITLRCHGSASISNLPEPDF
jgi:hypothetical protein